jgi:hypothetical protein
MELSERPRVQTTFRLDILVSLASSYLGSVSNISQVLENDRATGGGILDNAFGEDMVVISSLAKQFTRELFEVSLSALCAFCLELTTNAEDATFLLFPTAFTQEVAIAGDGRVIQPKVNANHLIRVGNVGSRDMDNDVEEVSSVMETQVSGADFPANVLGGMFGDRKAHLNTAGDSGEGTCHALPLDPIGSGIIADGSRLRLWTTNRLELGSILTTFRGLSLSAWDSEQHAFSAT